MLAQILYRCVLAAGLCGVAMAQADFTLTAPSSVTGSYNQASTLTVTLTPVNAPPGSVALTSSDPAVAISPNPVALTDMTARSVTLTLPARTASYSFALSAQAGSNPAKTQNIQVNIASPPSISLTLGAQSPSPLTGGAAASLAVTLGSTGYTGTIDLTCTSNLGGLGCTATAVPINAGGTATVNLPLSTTPGTPNGAGLTVVATPRAPNAPAARSAGTTLSLRQGFSLVLASPLNAVRTVPLTTPVTVTPFGGFTGAVSFACSGVTDMACPGSATLLDGNPVTASLTITTTASTPTGSPVMTLTGTSGAVTGTTTATVNIGQAIAPAFFNPIPAPVNQFSNVPRLARGNIVTFRWSAGFNLTGYRIQLGYGVNSGDFHDQTTNNLYSDPVTVPINLAATTPVYITLTGYNGSTAVTSTTGKYEIWFEQVAATMSAPAAGSTLSSSSVIFSWSNGSSSQRRLSVGTLGPGSSNILAPTSTTDTLMMVSGLPVDGRPVYVTLESSFAGQVAGWQFAKHYTYNATGTPPGGGPPGTVPGTVTLSAPSQTVITDTTTPITVSVNPSGGFGGMISITCSGIAGVSCVPASASVPAGSALQAPVSVQVSAGAATGVGKVLTLTATRQGQSTPLGSFPIQIDVSPPSTVIPLNSSFRVQNFGYHFALWNDNRERTFTILAAQGSAPLSYAVWSCDDTASNPAISCSVVNPTNVPSNLLSIRLTVAASVAPGSITVSIGCVPKPGYPVVCAQPAFFYPAEVYRGVTITSITSPLSSPSTGTIQIQGSGFQASQGTSVITTTLRQATINVLTWSDTLITANVVIPPGSPVGQHQIGVDVRIRPPGAAAASPLQSNSASRPVLVVCFQPLDFAVRPQEISFLDDVPLYEDPSYSFPQGRLVEPEWQRASGWNAPVAYVGGVGRKMRTRVVFSVEPAPACGDLSLTIEGQVPGFGTLRQVGSAPLVPVGATSYATELVLDSDIPFGVDYRPALPITWRHSVAGTFITGETQSHKLHVLLNNPIAKDPGPPPIIVGPLYFTTALLATATPGATTELTAFQNTWAQFSVGGNGPRNIRNYLGLQLSYYPEHLSFSACNQTGEIQLLRATYGQCGAFMDLFRSALAANGISSNSVLVDIDQTRTDYDLLLVRDWQIVPGATPGSDGTYNVAFPIIYGDMVPHPGDWRYGDLFKLSTIPGQNSSPPQQSAFELHYVLKVSLAGVAPSYFDPSYGVAYEGPLDFERKAVQGYAKPNLQTSTGSHVRLVRDASGIATPLGWICFTVSGGARSCGN